MLSRATLPRIAACSCFLAASGTDFSLTFQDPEDHCFTACCAAFLPADTARTKMGFIDFNLTGEGR